MLPHSNRGELFYKRRLSCYNFTVYDVKKHHAGCFPWNESIAKRGANEISSYLSEYITQTDKKSEKIYIFAMGVPVKIKTQSYAQ